MRIFKKFKLKSEISPKLWQQINRYGIGYWIWVVYKFTNGGENVRSVLKIDKNSPISRFKTQALFSGELWKILTFS